MSHGAIACIVVAVYFRRCVSGSMEHRRRWLSLCPVVPLCGATDYDEVSKKIFAANPTISGDVLHAFLLRGYRVNVAASELEHRSRSHDHHPDPASTRHGWESRSRDQRHEARVSRSRSRGHRCKDISGHRSRSRAHHRDATTIVHFQWSPNRAQRCEGTVGQTLYGPFGLSRYIFFWCL